MCFEVRLQTEAIKAKQDIICYKVISVNNAPWFKGTHGCEIPYKINGDNKRVKIKPYEGENNDERIVLKIDKGYHSFITRHGAENLWSYKMTSRKENKISRFIIPAGTIYYQNRSEYVSENIILIE
jgi:hypothetical protein